MSLFLVDVNLPKNFSFFNHDNFIFVADINLQMTDTEIWNYALKNNLIILTKDTDFYSKFLLSDTFPKIVYFKIGNLRKLIKSCFEQKFIELIPPLLVHLSLTIFI